MPISTHECKRQSNHPTTNIAVVAEKELNDYVRSEPTYIRDTTDFVQKIANIQRPLPENTIPFCYAVKALYPSVPCVEVLKACEAALNKSTNPTLPTEDVLEIIDVVLEKSQFRVQRKAQQRERETMLGMHYACTFTCLHVHGRVGK